MNAAVDANRVVEELEREMPPLVRPSEERAMHGARLARDTVATLHEAMPVVSERHNELALAATFVDEMRRHGAHGLAFEVSRTYRFMLESTYEPALAGWAGALFHN